MKQGYSGVVTYVKQSATPLAARTRPFDHGPFDDEGRLVITDHGDFVLFNVYVPNSGGDGKPRLEFKLGFLAAMVKLSTL